MSDRLLKKGFINDNFGGLLTERYAVLGSGSKTYLLLTLKNTTDKTVNSFRFKLTQNTSKIIEFNEEIPPKSEKVVNVVLKHNVIDFEIKTTEISLDGVIYSCGESEDAYISPNANASIKESTVLKPIVKPIFAICALILMIALSIAAAFIQLDGQMSNKTFSYDGAVYTFVDEMGKNAGVKLTGLREGAKNVTIRNKVKNHDVFYVAGHNFSSNDIKKLTIEGFDTVNFTFSGCSNLTSVRFIGVKNIGDNVFSNCFTLKSFYAEGLETIGEKAFFNDTRLEDIEIKSDFITLEAGAFANLRKLTNLKIDALINYNSHNILQSSMSLVNLSLKNLNYNYAHGGVSYNFQPVTVTDLFGKSSVRSQGLKNLEIEYCDLISDEFCADFSLLSSVKIKNGNIDTLNKSAFANCWALKTLELPSTINKVEGYALYGTGIASFDASNLSQIGEYAFADCRNLTKFDLKNNARLNVLEKGAFSGSGIVEFHFPENTEVIPSLMFMECRNLLTVTAPPLKEIGEDAFNGCTSLKTVLDAEILATRAYYNCTSLTEIILFDNIEIGVHAFMACSELTSVTLPDSSTLIDFGAFDGCTSLTEITLPDFDDYFAYIFGETNNNNAYRVPKSLKKVTLTTAEFIGSRAFYDCRFIKEIILPSSITAIGENAFYGCKSLDNLILPRWLKSIGEEAFANCYKLYEVTNFSSLSIERGQTSHGKAGYHAKVIYHSSGQLRIPRFYYGEFEFIYDYENWHLINVAENSKELNFPVSVKHNSYLFYNYYIADHLIIENEFVNSIYMISSVMSVGEDAFDCPNLEKLVIDVSLGQSVGIGFGAFRGCRNVREITLPHIYGGYLAYIFGAERLEENNCPSLTTITVTQEKSVPAHAFYGFQSVETINLPADITSIGDFAFYNCHNLAEISLGQQLTHIGDWAFYNSGIREIELPSSLKTIGEEAFRDCARLRKVTLNSSPTIGNMAFFACFTLREVVNNGSLKLTPGSETYGYISFYVEEKKIQVD